MCDPIAEGPVVIGADGSQNADDAIQYYIDNFHRKTNKLIIVVCTELQYQPIYNEQVRQRVAASLVSDAQKHNKQTVKKYVDYLVEHKIDGEVYTDVGNPGHLLVTVAEQRQAQLIVLGSRGLGRIQRAVMGSVSDHVVHHARCPVMVCPH